MAKENLPRYYFIGYGFAGLGWLYFFILMNLFSFMGYHYRRLLLLVAVVPLVAMVGCRSKCAPLDRTYPSQRESAQVATAQVADSYISQYATEPTNITRCHDRLRLAQLAVSFDTI